MERQDYLKLAIDQFNKLREETLDEDRHSLGAGNEYNYEVDGIKFKIAVDGYWEKSTWFDWQVYDSTGNKIFSGTEC